MPRELRRGKRAPSPEPPAPSPPRSLVLSTPELRRGSPKRRRRDGGQPRFAFYGGKGGVGKTTCAAARAVAEARAGSRVLVVSTDPAHSLGDALGVRLGSRPSRIAASLDAVELDAPRAFARWLDDHRQALGDIVEHGTWLDRQDVEALLALPVPGVDELVALIEVARLARARTPERESLRSSARNSEAAYDLVIVDTAPTGHALRLLAAPDTVAAVAELLEAMQREHRLMREQLARVGRPEAADRLIALLAAEAHDAGALLRDGQRSAFHWVLLPEELSLAESEDGMSALRRARIPIAEAIVNRVTPDGARCPVCDRRRETERRVMAGIPRRLGRIPVRIVPAELREPRGLTALSRLGAALAGAALAKARANRPLTAARKQGRSERAAFSARDDGGESPPETIAAFDGARLLLFGGKGGVGKTTCAAATAVRLARAQASRRVLLLSTDPAHSLGDVFGAALDDRPRSIPGGPANLRVRELDAAAALAARREALDAAIQEIVAAFGVESGDGTAGGVRALMDLAPPGVDELLGIVSVAELLVADSEAAGPRETGYDLLVVDTAPTGHALRLLEMPDAARGWVQALMRVLLKYRALVHPGRLAAELLDLSKSIGRLQNLLHDRTATRFIVVTRAAEVPRLETERLMRRLKTLRLSAPAVIVNALTRAPGSCARCRATAAAERAVLATLTRSLRRSVIILTPLAAPPPRGVAALHRWAARWATEN
jgi:arsenite-transporting ATPase